MQTTICKNHTIFNSYEEIEIEETVSEHFQQYETEFSNSKWVELKISD